MTGGPAAAMLGAIVTPALARALVWLDERFFTQRLQSAAGVLDAAAESAGTTPDAFVTGLDDPSKLQLAGAAIQAGAATVLDYKIRALGRALATGALAEDDAVVEIQALVIAALAELEAPHIRLLQAMTSMSLRSPFSSPPWTLHALGRMVPSLEPSARLLLNTLERVYAVERMDTTKAAIEAKDRAGTRSTFQVPAPKWRATDFGERLLDLLAEAGADRPSETDDGPGSP